MPAERNIRRLVLSSLQTDICDRILRLVVDSSIALLSPQTLRTGEVGILVLDLGRNTIFRLEAKLDSIVDA